MELALWLPTQHHTQEFSNVTVYDTYERLFSCQYRSWFCTCLILCIFASLVHLPLRTNVFLSYEFDISPFWPKFFVLLWTVIINPVKKIIFLRTALKTGVSNGGILSSSDVYNRMEVRRHAITPPPRSPPNYYPSLRNRSRILPLEVERNTTLQKLTINCF